MNYSNEELIGVLKMFNKGKLDIQGNPVAIAKLDILKQLERRGYIKSFPIDESNLPPIVLLTDKGIKSLLKGEL